MPYVLKGGVCRTSPNGCNVSRRRIVRFADQRSRPLRRISHMQLARILVAASAVAVLATLASAAPRSSAPGLPDAPPRLPSPAGRAMGGTTVVHLVDARRGRELSVQIWYPARRARIRRASA